MKPFPTQILALARRRHGTVTLHELTSAGVSGRQRKAWLRYGMLEVEHSGVYRLGTHEPTFHQRCHAALLAAPDCVLRGRSGGRIYGLRKVWSDDVHILGRRTVKLEGVNTHQSDFLRERDVREIRGLRVLSPSRLLCDLAYELDDDVLESVYEQFLDRGAFTAADARSMAREFVAQGRPGSIRIRRLLDTRPDALRPPNSDLELRAWRALSERGIDLERQFPIKLRSGGTIHADLAHLASRTVIEVDHQYWHGGRLDIARDKRRDRELLAVGWTTVRVTDEDIHHRLLDTTEELVRLLRSSA